MDMRIADPFKCGARYARRPERVKPGGHAAQKKSRPCGPRRVSLIGGGA
jgi:hypothetical protein